MPKTYNSMVYDLQAAFQPETINGMCIGYFRLSTIYQGIGAPFGFDWIRTGDAKDYVEFDEPYEQHLGRYTTNEENYVSGKKRKASKGAFLPDPKMYSKLCKSYPIANISIFPSPSGRRKLYLVPVLSIYPYSGQDEDIAQLILELRITKSPSKIQLIYDTLYFEITGNENIPTNTGEHRVEISVKCIKEFPVDEFIRIVSYNSKGKRRNAGLIRICKNDKNHRRKLDILLVNVKYLPSQDEDSIPFAGSANEAQAGITYYLRHAFITPMFDTMDLDLGYQEEMCQRITIIEGRRFLIIRKKIKADTGKLVRDNETQLIEFYLAEHLEKIRNIDNYDVIVYCFGENLLGIDCGQFNQLSGHSIEQFVSLKKNYKGATACHETLHTLGLSHTFKNTHKDGTPADFTYEQYKTDNLMDYSHHKGITRTNLWEWQWKLIRVRGYLET